MLPSAFPPASDHFLDLVTVDVYVSFINSFKALSTASMDFLLFSVTTVPVEFSAAF